MEQRSNQMGFHNEALGPCVTCLNLRQRESARSIVVLLSAATNQRAVALRHHHAVYSSDI
jgi:hypothetical protein